MKIKKCPTSSQFSEKDVEMFHWKWADYRNQFMGLTLDILSSKSKAYIKVARTTDWTMCNH